MIRLSDVRYALRLWRRYPTLVVAGVSLGLGVGATTTMYSVVNRVAHLPKGFISGSLAQVSCDDIIARSIEHFRKADGELGRRITEGIAARQGRALAGVR